MQIKKIAALVALACVGLSGQAMASAMTPAQKAVVDSANDVAGGGANPRILFISGASAVQKGFTNIISSLIPGTKVYFTDNNGKNNAVPTPGNNTHNYEAVAGVLDPTITTGGWGGKEVIIVYRVAGGSVFGVNPVARAEAIESLNVTSSCDDGGYAAANGLTADDKAFECPVTLPGNYKVPDAGVSDVAPVLFQETNNVEGEPGNVKSQLTETELLEFANTLYNTPLYALAFGVPTTNNLPIALNRAKVAAIMSGTKNKWSEVDSSLAADDVVICRRVPGSGTQAVYNLHFGNFPCGPANVPVARDANETVFNPTTAWTWTDISQNPPKVYSGTGKYTIGANTGTVVVIENSASGDVRTCLDKAVTGGTYVTKNRNGESDYHLVEFTGTGKKAIGVLSMDSLSSSKTTANGGNWQFRSLDGNGTYVTPGNTVGSQTGTGTFPTLANLIDGTWDMQGWISFNTPARTESNAAKLAMITKLIATAKSPAALTAAGLGGVAAAIPGGDYSGAGVELVGYAGGNQCAPLTLQ